MSSVIRGIVLAAAALLSTGATADGGRAAAQVGAVSLSGLRSVPEAAVREALVTSRGAAYDPGAVSADARTIQGMLEENGRPRSVVKAAAYRAPSGRVAVRFDVDEGQAAPVGGIQILGNVEITDSEIESRMETRVPGFLGSVIGAKPFDPFVLLADTRRIRELYATRGFPDARVVSAVSQYDPSMGRFFVNLLVSEGEGAAVAALP